MTIQESNKLIAEFMGWMPGDGIYINYLMLPVPEDKFNAPFEFIGYEQDELQFHQNWEWLMPVVEKIESIYDEHHGYFGVHISSNSCSIEGTNLWKSIQDLQGYGAVYCSDPLAVFPTKIESVYHAVVQFIIWYNANKL